MKLQSNIAIVCILYREELKGVISTVAVEGIKGIKCIALVVLVVFVLPSAVAVVEDLVEFDLEDHMHIGTLNF